MATSDEHAADDPPAPVVVVERGAFTEARCACGWRGAARRSRTRARQDAVDHAAVGCPATRPTRPT